MTNYFNASSSSVIGEMFFMFQAVLLFIASILNHIQQKLIFLVLLAACSIVHIEHWSKLKHNKNCDCSFLRIWVKCLNFWM